MARSVKVLQSGQHYSETDWDAVDLPEITGEELANMRPAKEVLPSEFFNVMEEHRKSRGRSLLGRSKK